MRVIPRLIVVLLLGACSTLANTARAAWPNDPNNGNVALSVAAGSQNDPVSIPDGAGGAIVAWVDIRSGSSDIYVQRVSAAGGPLWTANGVALCTAAGTQSEPRLTSDGAGGAIVAWQDQRGGVYDIYARRVTAAGVPQWTANGVAVCTATGVQYLPEIATDNAGGAIVGWQDQRTGAYDTYVQRLNSSGANQWTANGVALCTATGDQQGTAVLADGAGGAFVAWQDARTGTTDIYAQRVNASGAAQWTANGIGICTATGGQLVPELISDGGTGAILAWSDARVGTNYDIYLQRVTAAGVPQWGTNGVAACTAVDEQQSAKLATDGAGGAIVTWFDRRSGTTYDVYVQRMSAAGVPLWVADGTGLATGSGSQYAPKIVTDGTGGAIVTWYDSRSLNDDIYAQRISAAGAVQWTANGVALSSAVDDQYNPTIVADGSGGAIVAWADRRNAADYDLYAQRIERFGRLGNPEPVITGVKDVRNDQGGYAKVSWSASYLDADPVYGVLDYRIWRSLPAFALTTRQAALSRGITEDADDAAGSGKLLVLPFATQGYAWEMIGTQAAAILPSYSYAAATAGDSVPDSNPRTAFMVEARQSTSISGDRWFSAPDSGYSVDNIAPAAPVPLTGFYSAGTTRLAWNPNLETDLAGYRIYRGSGITFVPGPANLVSAQADTGAVDAAGAPYVYKVTAVDIHGNESLVATLIPTGTLDAQPGDGVAALAFTSVSPNPIAGEATLSFALPRAGRVQLEVLDVSGRRVAMVADGAFAAGRHSLRWEARDATRSRLTPGVYLCRLSFEGRALTQRVVATK